MYVRDYSHNKLALFCWWRVPLIRRGELRQVKYLTCDWVVGITHVCENFPKDQVSFCVEGPITSIFRGQQGS